MARRTQTQPRIDLAKEDATGPLVTRFGSVVGAGALAALVASIVPGLRMGDGGSPGRALEQWLVLAALATPLCVVTVGVVRRARAGVAILVGDGWPALVATVILLVTVTFPVLWAFGAVLSATTHHRGLGGATFAVAALLVVEPAALVAARIGRRLVRASPSVQRGAAIAASVLLGALVALVLVRSSGRPTLAPTAAGVVDVVAMGVACAVASSRSVARARLLAIAGPPAAAVLVLVGAARLRANAEIAARVTTSAPVLAKLAAYVAR